MKTIIVTECENISVPDTTTFDLKKMGIKDCVGCWTCSPKVHPQNSNTQLFAEE